MKKHISQHTSQRGFTLVELMIVIGIIGLLTTLAMPNLARARDRLCGSLLLYEEPIMPFCEEPIGDSMDGIRGMEACCFSNSSKLFWVIMAQIFLT